MNKQQLKKIMTKAQDICAHSGGRLTDKRKRILEILLLSKTPLSAYEVADTYNKSSENAMPAMSAYRMLDFLESEELVHKLSSTNKYVACSHIACDHAHQIPQFLICGRCQAVKEIGIAKHIVQELDAVITNADYKLINPQLELQCLCKACSNLAE
ncbi:Fur family transcriptional regulator [Saccharophagus degradans]|uniref:Transcriptional repressor n=1 Tax=Saccharophagus degradans TaxID=86304 RepID=A0AAW7X0B5_9GAMM|nr:transcriptional repressor [Saccharophagus degradans]MDO6421221.1 transcriptional repressor [Saccharophagus degradans]MDO6605868.1 transcriptional repressor [Saccharophagus degradans]